MQVQSAAQARVPCTAAGVPRTPGGLWVMLRECRYEVPDGAAHEGGYADVAEDQASGGGQCGEG